MTWATIGEFNLGSCVPLALQAQAGLDLSIGLVLPELQAKLGAYLGVQAQLAITPPSLALDLEAAIGLVAQLQATISLGLPGIEFDLSIIAGLIAELQLSLGGLQAQLAFSLQFGLLLGTPGIVVAVHEGQIGDVLPGGMPGGFGPAQPVWGVGLFATDAGSRTALETFFRTAA